MALTNAFFTYILWLHRLFHCICTLLLNYLPKCCLLPTALCILIIHKSSEISDRLKKVSNAIYDRETFQNLYSSSSCSEQFLGTSFMKLYHSSRVLILKINVAMGTIVVMNLVIHKLYIFYMHKNSSPYSNILRPVRSNAFTVTFVELES